MRITEARLRQVIREEMNRGRILTENARQISAVYCDMDGVLVDFEAGAVDLLTAILDGTADPVWTAGSKSMAKNIERIKTEMGEDWRPSIKADLDLRVVRQVMLSAISSAPGDFFESLPPLEDGINELWPFLNGLGVPVHILSAPIGGRPGTRPAGEGKRAWCDRYLSPAPDSVIIVEAAEKPRWAQLDGSFNVLVDDKAKTVDGWNEMGGMGILHIPGRSRKSISEIQARL